MDCDWSRNVWRLIASSNDMVIDVKNNSGSLSMFTATQVFSIKLHWKQFSKTGLDIHIKEMCICFKVELNRKIKGIND